MKWGADDGIKFTGIKSNAFKTFPQQYFFSYTDAVTL